MASLSLHLMLIPKSKFLSTASSLKVAKNLPRIFSVCAYGRSYHLQCQRSCHLQRNSPFTSQTLNDRFIPISNEPCESDISSLQQFVDAHKSLFVITGAGLSTESGIPDYRSEGVGLYATSPNRPVQYIDFLKRADIRQRYWARNYLGWPRFSSHQPNRCHYILSDWERKGKIHWLVTQNVDALHYKAGSKRITELHGSTHRVLCLSCNYRTSRRAFQSVISEANSQWSTKIPAVVVDRPDGDIDLDSERVKEFKVPACPSCGGILKPEVTFFGDNVPKATVHQVLEKMFQSDGVLVLGSSLEVYSGYRFVNRAHGHNMKIAIVNIGPTRGDQLADVKISARCGDVLQRINVDPS